MISVYDKGIEISNSVLPLVSSTIHRKKNTPFAFPLRKAIRNEICLVYDGSITYHVNNTEYTMKSGDLIYIPKGYDKASYVKEGEYLSSFHILFEWVTSEKIDFLNRVLPMFNHIGSDTMLIDKFSKCHNLFLEYKTSSVMEANSTFLSILSELIEKYSLASVNQDQKFIISKIKNYINQNFDKKISVEDLAAIAGLNKSYLGTYFKQVTGMNIKEYINRIKVNYAKYAMTELGMNVSEAARYCGISDVYYFSKKFKELTGKNPSSYSI